MDAWSSARLVISILREYFLMSRFSSCSAYNSQSDSAIYDDRVCVDEFFRMRLPAFRERSLVPHISDFREAAGCLYVFVN